MSDYLKIPMGDIADWATEHLPEDYRLTVTMRPGELDVSLYGPDDEPIEVNQDDVSDVAIMVRNCVNHARDLDGLGPLDFDGTALEDE